MGWFKTFLLDTLETGGMKNIVIDDERILMCRVSETEIKAIADQCTHDGGTLVRGMLKEHIVECPRHGAKFDVRSGAALCMPATSPVFTYKTRLSDDGCIEVELEDD